MDELEMAKEASSLIKKPDDTIYNLIMSKLEKFINDTGKYPKVLILGSECFRLLDNWAEEKNKLYPWPWEGLIALEGMEVFESRTRNRFIIDLYG